MNETVPASVVVDDSTDAEGIDVAERAVAAAVAVADFLLVLPWKIITEAVGRYADAVVLCLLLIFASLEQWNS